MHQEILTGPERRRRWSLEQKLAIVSEADVVGVNLSDVARRYDISRQQIYRWRGFLRRRGVTVPGRSVFLPVGVIEEDRNGPVVRVDGPVRVDHRVEIGLRNGRWVRVAGDEPEAMLHRILRIAEAS